VNGGNVTSTGIKHDGYEWRANHLAKNPGRDTFRLGGDNKTVHWFRERRGDVEGLITGAKVDKGGGYTQVLDRSKPYWVSPEMRPALGSTAWGNQFRSEIADALGTGGMSPGMAESMAGYLTADHFVNEAFGSLGLMPFGGLGGMYGGFGEIASTLQNFGQMFLDFAYLTDSVGYGRSGFLAG
jgi:hypothetical protein